MQAQEEPRVHVIKFAVAKLILEPTPFWFMRLLSTRVGCSNNAGLQKELGSIGKWVILLHVALFEDPFLMKCVVAVVLLP